MTGTLDKFCNRVGSGNPDACEGTTCDVDEDALQNRSDVEGFQRAPRCTRCGRTIVVDVEWEEVESTGREVPLPPQAPPRGPIGSC